MVVNECRNTTVGIILSELGSLLFVLVKLEEYGLVGEIQFIKDMGDLPVISTRREKHILGISVNNGRVDTIR